MATIVDALLVTMGVESSGVDKGMEEARQRINSGVKNIVSSLAAPLMAAFAGFSAGAAINTFTTAATEIQTLSQSLGMSMERLQGWQFAAEAAGAEAAEVGNLFRDMSDKIVDATTFDGGELKDIAKELGIALKDAQGGMRATEDVILDLADAFQRVGEQKAVAFGMQLGLDPGMIAMMQKGSANIETMIAKQKELGGYTKEDAELAMEARYSFLVFGKSIEAATRPIIREILPALRWLSVGLTAFSRKIQENSQFIKIALGTVSVFMAGRLVPAIEKTIRSHDKAIKAFAPWALVLTGIALLIDDLVAYVHGGGSALAGFWAQFGTGEEILSFFKATWEAVLAGLEKMKPLIPAMLKIGAVFSIFAVGVGTMHVLTETVLGVGSAFKALKTVLATNPLSAVILAASLLYVYWDDIMAIMERVRTMFTDKMTAAGDALKAKWQEICSWFRAEFGWILDAWQKISGLPDSIGKKLSGVGDSIAEGAKGALDWAGNMLGFGDEEALPAPASGPFIDIGRQYALEALPPPVYNYAYNTNSAARNSTTTANFTGPITINTQATDAKGIAFDFTRSVKEEADAMAFAVDTGVRQ